jgi:hypothetical protein
LSAQSDVLSPNCSCLAPFVRRSLTGAGAVPIAGCRCHRGLGQCWGCFVLATLPFTTLSFTRNPGYIRRKFASFICFYGPYDIYGYQQNPRLLQTTSQGKTSCDEYSSSKHKMKCIQLQIEKNWGNWWISIILVLAMANGIRVVPIQPHCAFGHHVCQT